MPDSTYEMVGGLDKQIKEVKEVIELPIKHPELFESLGIAQPKGVLLYGPPGTGKTLLARAVAHHTDCAFIRVSGSELVQKYIGEGSRMVRELFVMAREHAPSIIFMDEIDSIGSSRGESGSGGGDSEVQRTMLELLNQLDGFEATKDIKVIMATNRIDILDAALLRPGRIDRKIEFPPPGPEARVSILRIHSRKVRRPLCDGADGPDVVAARHQPQSARREDGPVLGRRGPRHLLRGRHVRAARAETARHSGASRFAVLADPRRRTLSSRSPRSCASRASRPCRPPSCSPRASADVHYRCRCPRRSPRSHAFARFDQDLVTTPMRADAGPQ